MCRGGGTPRSSSVFIDTGARLSEVTNLKMSDVDLDDQTLSVRRKGLARPRAPDRCEDRQCDRPLSPRAPVGPPRIVDRRQGWDDTERHRAMLRRRATGTGIGHIHPHQFRHTFARQRVAAEGTEGEV